MQKENTRRGFTLIELLVVVLIIGILAAVAVPQYQKAVAKARTTEALAMLKALVQAEEVYFLSNGEYTNDIQLLDVQPEDNKICTSREGDPNHPFQYCYLCINQASCAAYANSADLPVLEFVFNNSPHSRHIENHLQGTRWCHTNTSNTKNNIALSICQSLGHLQEIEGLPNVYYKLN